MTGYRYWPSLFGRDGWILAKFFFYNADCVCIDTERTSLVNKRFIWPAKRRTFSRGTNAGNPE